MPTSFTSLEDPATVDNVLAFLEPYVPYTLGPIENIVNSRPELVKPIKFYTSFEIDLSKSIQRLPTILSSNRALSCTPALFSITAFQPREQARSFGSADLKSSGPATPEEEAHVQAFFWGVVPVIATFLPDNEGRATPECDISPVGAKGRGYHIGRIHGK